MFGIRKLKRQVVELQKALHEMSLALKGQEERVALMDSALYDIASDTAIALCPPMFEVGDRVQFNMTSSIDDQGYIGRIVERKRNVMSSWNACNKYKYIAKYEYLIIRDGDDCVYNGVVEWDIIDLPVELLSPPPRPKKAASKKGRKSRK